MPVGQRDSPARASWPRRADSDLAARPDLRAAADPDLRVRGARGGAARRGGRRRVPRRQQRGAAGRPAAGRRHRPAAARDAGDAGSRRASARKRSKKKKTSRSSWRRGSPSRARSRSPSPRCRCRRCRRCPSRRRSPSRWSGRTRRWSTSTTTRRSSRRPTRSTWRRRTTAPRSRRRATDTNLQKAQQGNQGSAAPSDRQDTEIGDEKAKIAQLDDEKSALGRKAPEVTPHAEPELSQPEPPGRRSRSRCWRCAMRPRREHELTPETVDPSLPHTADGTIAMPHDRGVRGQRADADHLPRGKKMKLALTAKDYEYLFGADAAAERRLAQTERSKKVGRFQQRIGRVQSSLENFIPEVKPGNQTALNTRAAPFAAYIARMHRSIHNLWGFGMLEEWDEKSSSNPFNNPNLLTDAGDSAQPRRHRGQGHGRARRRATCPTTPPPSTSPSAPAPIPIRRARSVRRTARSTCTGASIATRASARRRGSILHPRQPARRRRHRGGVVAGASARRCRRAARRRPRRRRRARA